MNTRTRLSLVLSLALLLPTAAAAQNVPIEVAVSEDVLETYVGEYELRSTFTINITLAKGGLFAAATGQNEFPIFPESETKFFSREPNVQMAFTKDDAGVVNALILYQNGQSATAPRRSAPGVPLAMDAAADGSLPGEKTSIASAALSEERSLRILKPQGYELSVSTTYPVLFVVDGEADLTQAAGVASALASKDEAPGMIVVHTPAPAATQRANFARFLTDELVPMMEREYRLAPLTLVVGDADMMALLPESFARIAIGTNNAVMASFAGAQYASDDAEDPPVALRDGLTWMFDGWGLPNITALASQPGDEGWATIDAHYAALSTRFGYQVVPHEDVADRAAQAHARAGRWDETVREMERNIVLHPGSARTWNHLGDVYRMLCQPEKSRANYAKAYELASEMQYANVSNYAMELNRITTEIEDGRQCTSPADERREVEVDASTLESYAGTYEFSPRLSVVVTFERGRLWVQPTDQGKSPIFAESETKFFSKVAPVQFTFSQDGVLMRQSGRELEGRKVN